MPDIAAINNNTVGPLHAVQAPGRISGERTTIDQEQVSSTQARHDRVEVSHHANWLQTLRELPDVRQDRIEDVRRAIQDEAYVTPDKIEQAIDGMLRDALD